MGSELATGFTCSHCGQRHDVLPLNASVKAPLALAAVPSAERNRRVVITPDQCVIDDRFFFLRGRIVIPIVDLDEPFIWGVWAEVSPRNFLRTNEQWKTPGREAEPAFPGYLDTQLPLYGDTRNLELTVHTQPVGRRPHFTVCNPAYPLAQEQHTGITLARVEAIAAFVLHGAGPEALSI